MQTCVSCVHNRLIESTGTSAHRACLPYRCLPRWEIEGSSAVCWDRLTCETAYFFCFLQRKTPFAFVKRDQRMVLHLSNKTNMMVQPPKEKNAFVKQAQRMVQPPKEESMEPSCVP
jgi:hypothetical protein